MGPESEELRFRSFLQDAIRDVEKIHKRLCSNELRLRKLEGAADERDFNWDQVRQRADSVIAGVAAAEIGVQTFDVFGGEVSDHPLAAMPKFSAGDLELISSMGETSRFGAINMIQGYLGEEMALNAINAGVVPVPEGRYASYAESSNQPGYDLRLLSETDGPDLVAQVKISDSAAIIREHLERYPEVGIVYTNTEAAQAMIGEPGVNVLRPGDHFPEDSGRYVIDLGFTKDEIRSGAVDLIEAGDAGSFAERLQDDIPWIALAVIAGRAAYEILDTDQEIPEIIRVARQRVIRSLFASATSTATTAVTGEPLLGTAAGIGALFGGRAISKARDDLRFATDRLGRMSRTLEKIPAVPRA